MDRLQRAFKMLGGVEWTQGGEERRLVLCDGDWIGEYLTQMGEWREHDDFDTHTAESLLLRAMLDKAEKKWPLLTSSRHVDENSEASYTLYWSEECEAEIGHGPTLFDALLDALENTA